VKLIVLDTHALVWYLARPERLGRAARRVLREVDRGRAGALVPAIAAVELALLRGLGRTRLGIPELEATLERNAAISVLALDLEQAREFAALEALRDPFDRMIVAAARASRAPLVTADAAISSSGLVSVVWE
jgi:PIN domain nuclease of toxin-antitoxin system